jgi:hypothetical protein
MKGNSFIADKPLSQKPSAIKARQQRLHDDPKAIERAEKLKRYASLKKASKVRLSSTSAAYHYNIKPKRWDEIARLTAAGRSVERIAIYLNMPEWIVKILVEHISATNAGQGTTAQNLDAANVEIKKRMIGGGK